MPLERERGSEVATAVRRGEKIYGRGQANVYTTKERERERKKGGIYRVPER